MGLEIEKGLRQAGYKLFGESNNKIETLILEIIKSKNERYLKTIPFILYKYEININKLYEKNKNKNLLDQILQISQQIFEDNNIKKKISLKTNTKITINYEEYKGEFELQLKNNETNKSLIDKQKIYSERNLEMNLSQIFTKKEKEIIKKIIDDETLGKTEYEYYFRKTKKKLKSIIKLNEFSKGIIDKKPELNEEPHILKRKLEKWMKNKQKINLKIKEYHHINNKIIIKSQEITGEIKITKIELKQIKDKEIKNLLKKYKEFKF
ncbi:MAG: hypothetical protein U9R00_02585 [Patescibacteria group bacterium]|nr:hypothetical protein [Patescibacteria group bacterium]